MDCSTPTQIDKSHLTKQPRRYVLYIIPQSLNCSCISIESVARTLGSSKFWTIFSLQRDKALRRFVSHIFYTFNLGQITRGPVKLRFFWIIITQHGDFKCAIDGDQKRFVVDPDPLSQVYSYQWENVSYGI